MERPERPSRHSKTHDKWKRIIEPAGDSDSSSDWSTDATCQESEMMSTRAYFDGPGVQDGAGPSTSGGAAALADARDTLMGRVRMSSLLPPHDFSSLLARYRHKRPAPPSSDHDEPGVNPPSYHLLHHDYAERDAERDAIRDLQNKYSAARSSAVRSSSAAADNFSFFLHSGTNGERKRSRLHRHQMQAGIEQHEPRANRTEPEDSDRELYVIRLPSPGVGPENAAVVDDLLQRDDGVDEGCRIHGERGRSPTMKLKFMRRSGSGGGSSSAGGGGGSSVAGSVYPRSFFGDLAPLSERSAAAVAAARHDAASSSSAEVQVISMAGPSGSRTPPRVVDRLVERSGPGDDEIIVIVEDQHSPVVDQSSSPSDPSTPRTPSPVAGRRVSPAVVGAVASAAAGGEEESLNQHLISLLECPVCTEYMAPPIHQCRRGHLLCAACKPKLPQCPTCRSRFTDSRNLAMEQVADRLLYPCKNRELEAGCAAQLRLKDKMDHEANCEYRAFHCTLLPCAWKGLKDALFDHSVHAHRDVLLIGSRQELLVNMGDLSAVVNRNWLVSAFDELFRVNFVSPKRGQLPAPGLSPARQHVLGCVQFIGPRSGANRYKYTIETRCDGANRCLRYSRNTHSDLSRCTNIYSAVDCFHMRGETAELVCERRDDDFHLPVVVTLSLNSSPLLLAEAV